MFTHSTNKRHLFVGTLILAVAASSLHSTGQTNPPVTNCNCPTSVTVTPDAPEKDGAIKLTPTKEGMVVISVVATPPSVGAIQPTFRIVNGNGEEVSTATAWSHTFNLSTLGLKTPFTLETVVDCPGYSSTLKKPCDTKYFTFGGCADGSCSSGTCQSGTGDVSGDVDPTDENPFSMELAIGTSSQGDESTSLYFSKGPNSHIAISNFKVRSNGGYTHVGNVITTGTTVTTISGSAGNVTININRVGESVPFRTYLFTSVTSGTTKTLTLLETRCDQQSITHVWSHDTTTGIYKFSTGNGLRSITKSIESDVNFVKIVRFKTYELVGGLDVLVSDLRLRYQTFPWGVRMVERVIDPDTANLVSTWTYGGPSDGYGDARLKTYTRHDGYTETHTYGAALHQVDSSGNRQEKTTWGGGTTTYETRTNGTLHEKTVEITSGNTITSKSYASSSTFLQTVTTYMPTGSDFGGLPSTISRTNGTMTNYTYARTGGNRVTTVSEGKFVSGNLTDGTTTVTTVNAHGQTIETKATDVPSQIVASHTKANAFDTDGRPTQIYHFPNNQNIPAYSESRTYSCCKLTSETDIHGVATVYDYDDLGRRTHSQTHGVVHRTIYKGLIQTTHRYASTSSEAATNIIAETETNLAGTIRKNREPNIASGTNGALVETTAVTTYQPAAGLSRRVVTTVPGNHTQTEDYALDGRLKKSTGALTPATEYAYTYTSFGNLFSSRAFLDADGITHREITSTRTDWLSRTTRSGRAATLTSTTLTAFTEHTYQDGRHASTTDPDGVVTRYTYNDRGERESTILERNGNTTTEYGIDQVTRSRSSYTNSTATPAVPVLRTEVHVWQDGAGETSPTLASYTERTPDGLKSWSWQIGGGVTATTSTTGLTRTITTTAPDGTQQIQQYANGLLSSVTSRDASAALISSLTYSYQTSIKRLQSTTDSRTGTTSITYRSFTADVPRTSTDPGGRVTTFTYDNRGRRTHVDAPNTFDPAGPAGNTNFTNVTVTTYNPDGTTASVTGAQNYTVSYTYDYADRMKTMTTTGTAGSVITAWNHSPITGMLENKHYNSNADGTTGSGPDYTYTAAGRLLTRAWARTLPNDPTTRVLTTYGYTHGRLTAVTYNDGTPNLAYEHDNLGRVDFVTRGGILHAEYLYDPTHLRLTTEMLNKDVHVRHLKRNYDSLGRPISLNLTTTGNTSQYTTGYSYDTAGRLQNVWHHPTLTGGVPQGNPTVTYGYTYDQPTSSDLRTGSATGAKQDHMPYTLTRNAAGADPALTATRTYEATRDVLRSIENKAGTTVVSSFTYGVNPITQRESVATAGTAFAGTQADWAWQYDSLGQVTRADHAATPASDRAYQFDNIGNRTKTASGTLTLPGTDNWTSNALNQYSSINIQSPIINPQFDPDGNMTSGPVPGTNGDVPGFQPPSNATAMNWDGENRLISFAVGANTISFAYDHLSRLVTRSYNGTVEARYHYDGWNRIAEYNSSGTSLRDTFTWGLDLSGTMQGAGGVGGLLATRWVNVSGSPDYFPTYDGNGNVSEYLTTAGAVEVHYEYDPFGGLTHRSGNSGTRFQYRFSTKPRIQSSGGLYYYGYRWYNTYTGGWPSPDPIQEQGGINLYGFVGNDGVNEWDYLGLAKKWVIYFTGGTGLVHHQEDPFDNNKRISTKGQALAEHSRTKKIGNKKLTASAILSAGSTRKGQPYDMILVTGHPAAALTGHPEKRGEWQNVILKVNEFRRVMQKSR